MSIVEDKLLRKQVEDLILSRGKYMICDQICQALNLSSRSYLSYRGIDVTEVNKSLGYLRREPSKFGANCKYAKKEALGILKRYIRKQGRYVSEKELRSGHPITPYIMRKLGIDLLKVNRSLGFNKTSKMAKFDTQGLASSIEKYIEASRHYVSQDEICEKFKVSLSFLTKSNINTVEINAKNGRYEFGRYFEVQALEILEGLSVKFETQKTYSECRAISGTRLRFDIYLTELNALIELDGSQHWDKTHRFWKESLEVNDSIKEKFCKENDIPLFRIKYPGRFRVKQVLETELLEILKSLGATTHLETEDVNAKNSKD